MTAAPPALSPAQVGLVLVDLQEGPLRTVDSMPALELRANAIALCKVARLLELPVVCAAAAVPGPAGDVLPEILAELPRAQVVKHATNDVWQTPAFVEAVTAMNRPSLAVAGLATDVGLMFAALGSVAWGHATWAIVDVSATLNARVEHAAWLRLSQGGVQLTSWSAFAGEVQGNYLEPPGPALRAVIAERLNATGGVFDSGAVKP